MGTFRDNIVEIKPGFIIYFALLLLVLPIRWIFAWIVAAGIHELCHFVALRAMRIRVISLVVGCSGAVMQTESMHPWQELISAMCGPFGGLLLLLFRKWLPLLSACAIIQTLFNLLPIYPLDGGRVIVALLKLLGIPKNLRRFFACKQSKLIVK